MFTAACNERGNSPRNSQYMTYVGTCNRDSIRKWRADSKFSNRHGHTCCVPSYHKLCSLTIQQKYQPLYRL